MRDSFIFYNSFFKAIEYITEPVAQSAVYKAICMYALRDEPINYNELPESAKIALAGIEPQLKANKKRYENSIKGGAPKGNKNAQKKQPNQPTVVLKKQPKQPNENENVNLNENENQNHNLNENVLRLFSLSIILNEPLKLTYEQYAQAAEVVNNNAWLKKNFRHISKIHKYHDRIITGYYDHYGSTDIIPTAKPTAAAGDRGAELLNMYSMYKENNENE